MVVTPQITLTALLIAIVLNLIVFFMYGADKKKAKRGEWRTPEKTLIIGGAIGPWGAIAGMMHFRHKTQKAKFKLNYLFAVLHIALAVLLIYVYC